jgi:hypothetical protein
LGRVGASVKFEPDNGTKFFGTHHSFADPNEIPVLSVN